MQIAEVRAKSQAIANSRTKEIIIAVYQKMVAAHNEFCGCNYCVILKDYVQLKKYACAYKRRMEQDNYPNGDSKFFDAEREHREMDNLFQIKFRVAELKKQKDQLKQLW